MRTLSATDINVDDALDAIEPRFQFAAGGAFVLDQPAAPRPIWGLGDDVLVAEGEATMIAGVQGAGKSTIGQQFALGRCGIDEFATLLDLPIAPGKARTLYLAMDRPRQIARSFRRMVGEVHRQELDDRLVVWSGPPPYDLAQYPTLLREMAQAAEADTVVVDSLKDAFIGLTDDEAAAGWNRARQTALTAGIQLLELHHGRKASNGVKRDRLTIDDVYGSTWLTSGTGSVIVLSGEPGDPVIGFHHVKQPMNEVGPFKLLHDHEIGHTSLHASTDLVALARTSGGITVAMAAKAIADGGDVTDSIRQKARRKLRSLASSGQLIETQAPDAATCTAQTWRAS